MLPNGRFTLSSSAQTRQPLHVLDKQLKPLVTRSGRRHECRRQRRGPYAIRETGRPELRRLRVAAGLTQKELADRAAVCIASVQGLELGLTRDPEPMTVARLALALGLSPDGLQQVLDCGVEVNETETA